jgi:aspartate/methionine/tyrosine aminotransferase
MHFRPFLFTAGILIAATLGTQAADSTFTRVYMLRNIEAPACIRVLNFAAPDTSKLRILSGSAKKLVVTDTAPNQEFIAELLEAERVLLVQGSGFNWPAPDHFRLVFLPHEDDLRDAIARLARFLAAYRRRVHKRDTTGA